jgi:hypothetical protein
MALDLGIKTDMHTWICYDGTSIASLPDAEEDYKNIAVRRRHVSYMNILTYLSCTINGAVQGFMYTQI